MSSSEVELSPSRMEAAEIETLVDGDEDSSRSNDGLPLCVRRRRLCLVCLIFIALAISVAVALGIIQGRNDMDEVSKPSKQVGSQGDETNNNVAAAPSAIMTSTPIPTASPTASPTANPTQWLPTAYPTALPVLKPTGAPPTAEMTSSPTATAVQQPTGAPPTALRTSLPTAFPTAASANEVSPFSEWYDANVTLSSGQMYEVIGDFIPHDDQAFTQGLTLSPDGRLFESTGLNGHSTIRELNPSTGEVLVSVPLDDVFFGEGLTYVNEKLIQITWKKSTAFIWNANDLTIPPQVLQYQTTKRNEGWGITHDPNKNELIVSDGSANLIFWNVDTLETLRTISVVRQDGSPANNMNELEFWRGRVLANVWFKDVLLVIHPETGVVEKEYDFSTLWPKSSRPWGADVFNGISISDDPDVLYVTGKKWNRMYKVKLLP